MSPNQLQFLSIFKIIENYLQSLPWVKRSRDGGALTKSSLSTAPFIGLRNPVQLTIQNTECALTSIDFATAKLANMHISLNKIVKTVNICSNNNPYIDIENQRDVYECRTPSLDMVLNVYCRET